MVWWKTVYSGPSSKVQQQIIRRAARLDTLTKEAVATLHDIRGMVGELKEAAGKEGEE